VAEIRHFETLRYEDQKLLETAIDSGGKSLVDSGDGSINGKGSNGSMNYDDFLAEYAKSNRSKCALCSLKIDKDSLRLGKMDYEVETPWGGGPVPRWFHLECFIKSISQLEFYGDITKVRNYEDLEPEDQKLLKRKIKPLKRAPMKPKTDQVTSKRSKKEDNSHRGSENNEEDRLLKIQSDRFFDLRSIVSTMKRKDLELLMSHMRQKYSYKNVSTLIDMATDVLLFGPIQKCPECKKTGGFELRGGSYICTSSSEWSPCTYETREPRRNVPDIPDELLERYEFFEDGYRFHVGKRIFSSKFLKAVEEKEAETNESVSQGGPLDGLTVGVISWKALKNKKTDIQRKVKMLGGELVTVLDRSVFVILTSESELEMTTPKIEVAKDLGVPFVSDDFLFGIKTKDDVVKLLSEHMISKWEGDLDDRYSKMNVKQLKQNLKSRAKSSAAKSIYKSSRVPKSQTLVVKDGTAVDPDSNLVEVGRVYRRGDNIYSVVLNSIDVARDKNSYYKMQVIEHEKRKEYYLFRSWGRIGCEVGGTTCREMDDSDDATSTFEQLFEEKTGNPFQSLASGTFRRIHGCYFPVEIDYNDPNAEKKVKLEFTSESKLEKPVQDLICFIFDIQRMYSAMKRFELDSEKMPLGKLSEKHILTALETLKELQQQLEAKSPKKPAKRQLVALTNKFYSLIPQSFGDGEVQLISSLEQVDEKCQMLRELQEIELAYRMSATVKENVETVAVDQYYLKLDCSIVTLGHDTEIYRLLTEYVATNHAVTHSNYKLVVNDIFQVQRECDMKRFSEHRDKERYLLWHGSRATNFAGILSQGLRVAPREAPSTGFMFGKGIYFADMSSKAANYCMADPSNPTGLLLLCEVALGKTHDLLDSDPKLPKGLPKDCHSVRGIGKSTTDPKTHVKIDTDLTVPIGKQVPNKGVKSQLLYNEYVIYSESQTMLRYIVQVTFDFKR